MAHRGSKGASAAQKLLVYMLTSKQKNKYHSADEGISNERCGFVATQAGIDFDLTNAHQFMEQNSLNMIDNFNEYKKNGGKGKYQYDHEIISFSKNDLDKHTPKELYDIALRALDEQYMKFSKNKTSLINGDIPFNVAYHIDSEKPHFHFQVASVDNNGLYMDKKNYKLKYRKIAEKYENENDLVLTGKNKVKPDEPDMKIDKSIKRQFRAINEHIKRNGKLKGLSQAEINKELKKNDARMNKKLNSDGLLESALWTAHNNANNSDEFLQILDDMKADGLYVNVRSTLRKKDDIESGIKGLSYALTDKDGNVITCMAASKISKVFSPKNFFEAYPEMEDYLLGREHEKGVYIKPAQDFKQPKPKDILPMVFWLNKHNNKIAHYYDNTKPKPQSLMCKQDTETGTITILDSSREGAFKIMQLSKDWNGILITTNSSKDASYRLAAWLKLDTEPKKSIKDFEFDKSSQVKEMKWSDFRQAVDGMKFTQEEISHIKKNILSPQDAEKYSDELDNMLKVNKNDVKNIVDNILDGAEEERKAKLEAEQRAKAERETQEAKAKLELEQKAKQEAAEKSRAQAQAKQEAERKAKAEQEAREKAELEAKAKQEAEKQEQEQISNRVAEKIELKTYKRGLFEFGGKKIEEVKELIDEGYNINTVKMDNNIKPSEILSLVANKKDMAMENITCLHAFFNEKEHNEALRKSFMTHATNSNPDYVGEGVEMPSHERRLLEERSHDAKSRRGDFIVPDSKFNGRKTQGELEASRKNNNINNNPKVKTKANIDDVRFDKEGYSITEKPDNNKNNNTKIR